MNIPYTHCASCDVRLDDEEATATFTQSGGFVGLCRSCAVWLPDNVPIKGLRPRQQDDEEHDSDSEDLV